MVARARQVGEPMLGPPHRRAEERHASTAGDRRDHADAARRDPLELGRQVAADRARVVVARVDVLVVRVARRPRSAA